MALPPYTIARLESFIQKSSRLIQHYPTLIEFNKFINWALQKNPRYFNPEPPSDSFFSLLSTDLHTPDLLLEARRVTNFPKVKVIYHIDESKKIVTLICINLEE
jgi:hypothetical protein